MINFLFYERYGEIVNINMVRDKTTGKPKGFAFLCYEDQRSTILAVDNLNSIKVNIKRENTTKKESEKQFIIMVHHMHFIFVVM